MADYQENYVEEKVCARVGVKVVILNNEEKILLVRRSEKLSRPYGWSLPGGGLEAGEDPIKGLQREVMEETRLSIVDIKPVYAASETYEGEFIVTIGYQARAISPAVTLNWEHDQYVWVDKEEAISDAKYDLLVTFAHMIEKVQIY